MKKGWTTTKLITIGALAVLSVIISLPGATVASLTGVPFASAIADVLMIGVAYPLVALIIRTPGAVTLWAFIKAVIVLPLPIAAPPGFIAKIPYLVFWGLLADFIYRLFHKSDMQAAVIISFAEVGLGGPLAILLWTILGAPQLAAEVARFATFASVTGASLLGLFLGLVAYYIYFQVKDTQVVKRIQGTP